MRPSSQRPAIELLTAGTAPAGFADLVMSLARWCRPLAGAPWEHGSPPVATLASSSRAVGLERAFDSGRPVAVWVSDDDLEATPVRLDEATVLVSDRSRELDEALLDRFVQVPVPAIDVRAWPATMPHVRARCRSARGQPSPMIFDATVDEGGRDEGDVPADLALASVAIVDLRWATVALALATPTITDAQVAAALGALDGVHVVVAHGSDQLGAAEAVAADEVRAARLARAGRQLAERRHDRGAPAAKVARALGLVPEMADPRELLAVRIREMEAEPG